jgi:SAM-dependent methyltransferase
MEKTHMMQEHEKNLDLEMRTNVPRWVDAQQSELNWWAHFRDLPFYRNHSFERHWTERVSAFGINQSDFRGKNIIEVGCGPFGVVSCTFPESYKIGIDPLIGRYKDRAAPDERTLLVGSVGESLPIRADSADLVFCMNVIDHVMSAQKVMLEIRRILKKSARLILEVHTFPAIFAPIMMFDHPHTYHWTKNRLLQLMRDFRFTIDRIDDVKFAVPLALKSRLTPSYWKYIFGNWFMKLTYISATRSD